MKIGNIRIIPLEIDNFVEQFELEELKDRDVVLHYIEYLEQNRIIHHYGDMTETQWLAIATLNYSKGI